MKTIYTCQIDPSPPNAGMDPAGAGVLGGLILLFIVIIALLHCLNFYRPKSEPIHREPQLNLREENARRVFRRQASMVIDPDPRFGSRRRGARTRRRSSLPLSGDSPKTS